MKRNVKYITAVIMIAVLGSIIYYFYITKSDKKSELSVKNFNESVDIIDINGTDNAVSGADTESVPDMYLVHVCGEVVNPGVYRLEAGARISDAIEAAGGFTAGAATDYHNLAKRISDEQQIYVPDISEEYDKKDVSGYEAEKISDGRININTATKNVLMELKGIGEKKADNIIEYRQQNGGFASVTELMNVEGISESVYNEIKDFITTGEE